MSEPGRRGKAAISQLLDLEHIWSVLALIAVVAIAGSEFGERDYEFRAGDIADADVVAPIELRVPDPDTTAARREAAREQVIDVYDFDPFAWQAPVSSLNALYAWGRSQLSGEETLAWDDYSPEEQIALRDSAQVELGLPLEDEFMAAAWAEGFTAETELAAERLLRNQLQLSLVGTLNPLNLGASSALVIRDIADQQERQLDSTATIRDLNAARDWLARETVSSFSLSAEMEAALGALLGKLARPNLNYNSNETQMRRQAAAGAVDEVFYAVLPGRTIVREGDEVTAQVERELAALRAQWSGGGTQTPTAGLTVIVALAIFGLWRFVRYRSRQGGGRRIRRLYHMLLLILVGSVLMIRTLMFIGDAVASSFMAPPYNVADAYRFAIPFALGALALVLLVDAEVALIYAALQTVVVGAITGDVELALFSLLGSFAVVFGVSRFAERTQMFRVVMTLGIANMLAVAGLALMQQPAVPWTHTGFTMALAVFGAIQAGLLASALLPPLEYLFDTLTDIKLLELSNMNLPLLKELAVVAPGTYHHSVVIGTLTEKAAEAIGANPLFCRVASYYHDIGKMRQPEYFIENQKDGARNPHEKLSPHMSALVLARHVKEGIAYAEEHRLPRPLIDAIPEHHGTSLMRFFFMRARDAADIETVDEDDFRYPGPKPQTKETALIMLADGVEARSRLIEDPSPHKLAEMIRDQVRAVLDDGQLDECDITLRDLSRVEDAFLDVLSGMHHSRIEYPEPVDEAGAGAVEVPERA